MGKNHRCHDCGKIIEPDKELRFYPSKDISAEGIRFLCEGCADRLREIVKTFPTWREVRGQLLTPEEIAESDLRVAKIGKQLGLKQEDE